MELEELKQRVLSEPFNLARYIKSSTMGRAGYVKKQLHKAIQADVPTCIQYWRKELRSAQQDFDGAMFEEMQQDVLRSMKQLLRRANPTQRISTVTLNDVRDIVAQLPESPSLTRTVLAGISSNIADKILHEEEPLPDEPESHSNEYDEQARLRLERHGLLSAQAANIIADSLLGRNEVHDA